MSGIDKINTIMGNHLSPKNTTSPSSSCPQRPGWACNLKTFIWDKCTKGWLWLVRLPESGVNKSLYLESRMIATKRIITHLGRFCSFYWKNVSALSKCPFIRVDLFLIDDVNKNALIKNKNPDFRNKQLSSFKIDI